MIEQTPPTKTEPPAETNYLKEIAGHLKSIRSMLSFFVVLVIFGIIIQGCSLLM